MREKITISERGALTIPARLRRAFGINPNDELILEETDQGLLLRPAISVPIELYTGKRIAEFAREEQALGKKLARD
jgi:antitoxin PrlF